MKKKKRAVFLSDISAARIGIVLLQLQETNPGIFDEAIIYHFDFTAEEKTLLNRIMPCRFVVFNSPLMQENVMTAIFKQVDFHRFSPLIFSRFDMFKYLEEFDLVMWIDTDVLLQKSIAPLLEEADRTGFAIYREDPKNKSAFQVDYAQTNFNYPIPGYDMEAYLLCSGLIIVTRTLPIKADYTKWLTDKAIELLNQQALRMLDQGVINLLVQEFNIPVTPIGHNGKYGCWPYPGRDCTDAALIHAWGSAKFWNDWYLYNKFPRWRDYHQKWVELGGEALFTEFKPKVSILMPVYKPNPQYLKECLDSILCQKQKDAFYHFTNYEMLIIAEPEGAVDVEKIIQSYHDPRLILIVNEKREGIAKSLNKGLRLAQGDYIARMDADDIAEPSRFWKQVEYLDTHANISMCVSDYEYFGDMCEGRIVPEGELSRAWSLLTCPFDHPTVMFRKDFFAAHELQYDETLKYAEDWDLWIRAFDAGMTVGCVHETLLYHRWHSENAGQTEDSNTQMKRIIQKNFRRLNVDIPWEYVPVFCPWWGKAWNEEALAQLKTGLEDALRANKDLKRYDQESLEKAFSLRLAEAETGILPEMSWNRYKVHDKSEQQERTISNVPLQKAKKSWLKRFLKKLLKPFYRPFRHRYEDRIIDIQKSGWAVEGHVLSCITKLDQIITTQQRQIEQLQQELARTQEEVRTLISKQMLEMQTELLAKVFTEAENTRQVLSGKVFTEAENTRQVLSGKVFTEAENTRQVLSSKVFTETENTRQVLSSKVFTETENTRQVLSSKVFTEAENTRAFTENYIWKTECDLSEKIAGIDQVKRLIRGGFWNLHYELEQLKGQDWWNESALYDDLFYMENRYGSVVSARSVLTWVLNHIRCRSIIDFGCGTGTWLWVAKNLGVSEILGIDGGYVPKNMLMIPGDCFQAANLSKPFCAPKIYDIAMSLEVAEHLPESAADDFVASICKSANIVLFSAAHPGQGGDGHINEQPMDYWIYKFGRHSFRPLEIRQYFQNDDKIETWYRENLILFVLQDEYENVRVKIERN